MRHLTRKDVAIERLLRTVRTIAIVGVSPRRGHASLEAFRYLRRFGFDVVPVRSDRAAVDGMTASASVAEIPGQVDLVLVYGAGARVGRILEEARGKRADAVWLAPGVTARGAEAQAEAHAMGLVAGRDIVAEHREAWRDQAAGRPPKLGVHLRRRKPMYEDNRKRRSGGGFAEAGGGGRGGGGGGRATLDEKKMVRGKPSGRTGPMRRRRAV
jgi:uncharacterized protein